MTRNPKLETRNSYGGSTDESETEMSAPVMPTQAVRKENSLSLYSRNDDAGACGLSFNRGRIHFETPFAFGLC